MCGINGIAYTSGSGRQVDEKRLVAMRDILHHRGPDDGSVFVDANIGLGIAAGVSSTRSRSPAETARDLTIVYNGESITTPTIAKN